MKRFVLVLVLMFPLTVFAADSVIYDDGTGAQIIYNLPTRGEWNGKVIEYSAFKLSVVKGGKFLLFVDLPGKMTDDHTTYSGQIIIPSEFIDSAKILLSGGPPNSTIGVSKEVDVRDFKKVVRKKSWTEQE